ncbi:MAG: YqaA family protein [Patescibacteria group bacterium]|nr:YqaA family protein [Patescibacteria group bacterium]
MIAEILLEIFDNCYVALFVLSFLSSTLIPLGSEWFVYYLASVNYNIILIILIASVGNYLGAVTNYYIGIKESNTVLHKTIKFNDIKTEKAKEKFRKYGPAILFFSWLPIVGDPLTFVAGLLKYNFKKFTFYVFTGKIFRYVIIVLITFKTIN